MDALPSGTPEHARELSRHVETMSDCRNERADSGSASSDPAAAEEAITSTALLADGHVVDGKVAFMGSQNMIDSSYLKRANIKVGRHWQDLNIKITGEIIMELEAVFAMDWFTETGERLGLELELVDDPGADKALGCVQCPGERQLQMPRSKPSHNSTMGSNSKPAAA
jgi:hypothetical protein